MRTPSGPSHRRQRMAHGVVALAVGRTMALPAGPAQAARSSKPKEIVVVGSKVKDVVRSAGFTTEGNVVLALSDLVLANLLAAMDRAEKNGRYTLEAFDLDCPAASDAADERMNKSELIGELAALRGFRLARGFHQALNAYTNQTLSEAIRRATSNGRSTVRPHDL